MRIANAILIISLSVFSSFILFTSKSAALLDECSDVLIVFARGSGQEQSNRLDQAEAYKFFDEMTVRAPANLTVETRELEYPANGGSIVSGWPVWLNAELPWNAAGEYYSSVNMGISNLMTLLSQQHTSCPQQKFVLGGYSQGANVVGNALFQIGDNVSDKIAYVALFGDPKFKADSYAAMGDFVRLNGGILEPREQDFPSKYIGKLGSWCKRLDGICENELNRAFSNTGTHHTYPDAEILIAANYAAVALASGFNPTSIHPGRLGKKVDIVYVLDTTATMRGIYNDLKVNMQSLVQRSMALGLDTRIGLTWYNDAVACKGFPNPANVAPLSNDPAAFISKLNDAPVNCSGGAIGDDTYSGLVAAINGQPWRADARKLAILLGGNHSNDPEQLTGYKAKNVIDAAHSAKVEVHGVIRGDLVPQISSFQPLFDGVGGQVIYMKADSTSAGTQMYKKIEELLNRLMGTPYSQLSATTGQPGTGINFSAGGSYDPNGSISKYEWDFDNDGLFDQITTKPNVKHNYSSNYHGPVVVKTTDNNGQTSQGGTSVSVDINNPLITSPSPPQNVVASVGNNKVVINWQPPLNNGGGPIEAYSVKTGLGELVGVFDSSLNTITLTDLPFDQSIRFSVEAINSAGISVAGLSNEVTIASPPANNPSDANETPAEDEVTSPDTSEEPPVENFESSDEIPSDDQAILLEPAIQDPQNPQDQPPTDINQSPSEDPPTGDTTTADPVIDEPSSTQDEINDDNGDSDPIENPETEPTVELSEPIDEQSNNPVPIDNLETEITPEPSEPSEPQQNIELPLLPLEDPVPPVQDTVPPVELPPLDDINQTPAETDTQQPSIDNEVPNETPEIPDIEQEDPNIDENSQSNGNNNSSSEQQSSNIPLDPAPEATNPNPAVATLSANTSSADTRTDQPLGNPGVLAAEAQIDYVNAHWPWLIILLILIASGLISWRQFKHSK